MTLMNFSSERQSDVEVTSPPLAQERLVQLSMEEAFSPPISPTSCPSIRHLPWVNLGEVLP